MLQLLLPEVAAHHRAAVLIDAVGEVLAGFREKSLNPIKDNSLVYPNGLTLIGVDDPSLVTIAEF